jgi:hypothetical protein
MLNADDRSLLTGALTAPPEFIFDQGIATTYSLDPKILLTIPMHLALMGRGREDALLKDPVALLEALRRVSEKLTVYSQEGMMQAPSMPSVLYGLLENMIVEAHAPHGGSFHAKLWILRFLDPSGAEQPLIRLVVLSRNLTADRSWDLSVQLEGRPGGRNVAASRELGELISGLPSMARGPVSEAKRKQAAELGQQVRLAQWDFPPGVEELGFHVLGMRRRPWRPESSDRLAVISPFISPKALEALVETTREPVALISRPESLEKLDGSIRDKFARRLVLHEAAETADGEAVGGDELRRDDVGLHAKAIILKRGWNTHLIVGSANATDSALELGRNLEVMVELVGKRSSVGDIDSLLGPGGLQEYLTDYSPPEVKTDDDTARKEAEKALEAARQSLVESGLKVVCSMDGNDWRLSLQAGRPPLMSGISAIRSWPLSVRPEQAVDASALGESKSIELGRFSTASVTGLVAFALEAGLSGPDLRFTLNLQVEGMPEDRDAAVMQTIVRNKEGFLRYLLLLLQDAELEECPIEGEGGRLSPGDWLQGAEGFPLLERLTKALSRDRAKLKDVERIVERLMKDPAGGGVVPQDFMVLWEVFRRALALQEGTDGTSR